MYSLLGLPTSIVISLLLTSHGVYKYVMNMGYKSWYKYFVDLTVTTTNILEIPLRALGLLLRLLSLWVVEVLVASHSSF